LKRITATPEETASNTSADLGLLPIQALEEGLILVYAADDGLEEVAVEDQLEAVDGVVAGQVRDFGVGQSFLFVLVVEKLVGLHKAHLVRLHQFAPNYPERSSRRDCDADWLDVQHGIG
jgi:hypothetical protein